MTKNKLSIIVLLTFLTSCSDFEKKGKPLFKKLNTLYKISLDKCKTTQKVWSTAIYDHEYGYGIVNNYVSDFNVAINRLEQEPAIRNINNEIDALSKEVTKDVEAISDKKHDSYDKLIALYTNVIELSKMAETPSGSLQSFGNDLNQKESQINMLITEIKARNPDFKEE